MEISIEQYNKMAERLTELEYKEAERQWIPCSERLPEEGVEVLCCFRNGDNYKIIVSKRTDFNYWSSVGRTGDTIAWMPLPEPYKESNGWTTVEEMSGWIKEVNE